MTGPGVGGWPNVGGQPSQPFYVPPPAMRVRAALQARPGTDYIFNFWTAFGWSLLTLGFFAYYVFYQLMRRMREHNLRRLELLDAALALGWEEAGRQGAALRGRRWKSGGEIPAPRMRNLGT